MVLFLPVHYFSVWSTVNMSELSEKGWFSFVRVANSILLEVLSCFYVCTFLPQGFNSETETGQCRLVIAISFYVSSVKLVTTKLVSVLWFALIGLLCFCYNSPN